MSGVKDNSQKAHVGVEAYVLKKITKDLPLEPIPTSLKWDHLSDLNLADPDFRTPARIDLVLGAEVFTSVLHDVRRTGPLEACHPHLISVLGGCYSGKLDELMW